MQPWLKTDGYIISKIINLFKSLLKPTICPVRRAPELRQLHFREEGEILANTCYIYCVTSWNEVRPTTQNGLPRVELQTNSCRHLVDTNNSWNKCVESQEMKQEIQTRTQWNAVFIEAWVWQQTHQIRGQTQSSQLSDAVLGRFGLLLSCCTRLDRTMENTYIKLAT